MPDDTLSRPPVTRPIAPAAQVSGVDEACAERARQWMATAVESGSFDTCLFAKLIAAREVRGERALLGLSRAQWDGLVGRHFGGAAALPALAGSSAAAASSDSPGSTASTGTVGRRGLADPIAAGVTTVLSQPEHAEFVASLRALLLQYVNPAVPGDDAQCLATIVAHACLRPDHLWRDLGLTGRDEVTTMLKRYFPSLIVLNVENLRWKKFLARQLALSLGKEPGPAPGCPGCEDYGYCFPPAS